MERPRSGATVFDFCSYCDCWFLPPLIQGRIEDLNDTITEVKNDYEFYEKHIRRFNKDLFRFGDLEDRKSAYVGLAETQRQRAQIQLRRVFYALLIVWCGLAIWSGFAYSVLPKRNQLN